MTKTLVERGAIERTKLSLNPQGNGITGFQIELEIFSGFQRSTISLKYPHLSTIDFIEGLIEITNMKSWEDIATEHAPVSICYKEGCPVAIGNTHKDKWLVLLRECDTSIFYENKDIEDFVLKNHMV